MQSSVTAIVVAVIVFIGLVIFLSVYYARDARVKRRIRKVPRTPIGNVQPGQVAKVVGSVAYLEQPLQAPLSGKPCAYYEVIVEQYRSNGKSGSWHRIIRDVRGQDFLISDDSGAARVVMAGAEIAVVKDKSFKSGTFNDAAPVLEAYLSAHGVSSTGLLGFNKRLRYTEGVLEAGEQVGACGPTAAEPNPDPTAGFAGYREHPSRLLLRSEAQIKLYVSDDKSVLG